MPLKGKTADEMRKEFYEALDRERSAREARDAAWEKREAAWEKREAAREKREAAREKRMAELEAAREADRKEWKEWKEDLHAWTKKMSNIAVEWGNYTNIEGGMVEDEGVAALRDLEEIGGMTVEKVDGAFQPTKKGREYDGVIHCPNARVLVECKRQLRPDDVRKFLDEQLRDFPQDCPELLDGHALYGAVAGATVDKDAQTLARKNGLFVIRIPLNRRAEILENKASPRPRE